MIDEDIEKNLKEDNDGGIPYTAPQHIAEIIEELEFSDIDFDENEEASGAVVSIISGEVDYDDAEKILDMLLYREYDEEEAEEFKENVKRPVDGLRRLRRWRAPRSRTFR